MVPRVRDGLEDEGMPQRSLVLSVVVDVQR